MSGHGVIVCDLDGVLWTGARPIPGAAEAVGRLRADGRRVAFLTNNSSRVIDDVRDQLRAMGVATGRADVLSSAQAAASVLAGDLAAGARVLVSGGPGVVEALEQAGLRPVANDETFTGDVAAVVCGMDRAFDFARLDRASAAVRAGARFVATNTDPTFPGADRITPGAGALVAAIATAAGREPEVAGKPAAPTVALDTRPARLDRRHRGRPAVDRRRARPRARVAVRDGALGRRRSRPGRAGARTAPGMGRGGPGRAGGAPGAVPGSVTDGW